MNKKVYIIGGGTLTHISNHFAITAPAYGTTARELLTIMGHDARFDVLDKELHLTKMAGGTKLETNEDIRTLVGEIKANPMTKIVFFNAAIVDYIPAFLNGYNAVNQPNTYQGLPQFFTTEFGKHVRRLETSKTGLVELTLVPDEKIIATIRQGRKDIFLVGFKSTCGDDEKTMYLKGLSLLKKGSINLVLVNDTKNHTNMIVTPEEAAYHVTKDRETALKQLVDIAWYRSHLTFTQSTVVEGKPIPWNSPLVPNALREAVNHCINGKAYKPFNGATVGHFAVKLSDTEFLTSIRKSDFNKLAENGLVKVVTDGPDTVLAYGAKPSVGGQSQRIVFKDHPGFDAILHFHSPLKKKHRDPIPVVSQREVECGSHQCGKNTSNGLKQFGNLKCVMLDSHGPNIVFNKDIDPKEVINFIEANFDLAEKTGGYNIL